MQAVILVTSFHFYKPAPEPRTNGPFTNLGTRHLGGNGNLNLNTSLDVDDDLLDDLGGGEEARKKHQQPVHQTKPDNSLDKTLVHAHLVLVPGLGTLTARSLAGDDVQGLGGQTDGALDLEGLGHGAVLELLAHLLEGGDLAGGQGDADLVDLLFVGELVSCCSLCTGRGVGAGFSEGFALQRPYLCGEMCNPVGGWDTYRALAEILLGLLERHLVGDRWWLRWLFWD